MMKKNERKHGGPLSALYSLFGTFFAAIFLILAVFLFMGRFAVVDGDSMLPNLKDGDRVVLSSFAYTPAYGDVIGAGKASEDVSIIKRVIALPGDTVNIDFSSHLITVNGRVITETYPVAAAISVAGDVAFPLKVPNDAVFVLGDNRNDSLDSRFSSVGCIRLGEIAGKAVWRLSPDPGKIK